MANPKSSTMSNLKVFVVLFLFISALLVNKSNAEITFENWKAGFNIGFKSGFESGLKKFDIIEKILKINNEKFEVNSNRGFWKGSGDVVSIHHRFDSNFAKGLSGLFADEGASTLIDLGAGMGNYSSYLKNDGFFVTCVDGNPNTQEVTGGHCSVADLSLLIDYSRHDWAYSIEVGEHLPQKFEDNFLVNLDRVSKRGVVLSWAVKGQGGDGHFNERDNDYIIQRMREFRFQFDPNVSKNLREVATLPWLKDTIMVFRKDFIQK